MRLFFKPGATAGHIRAVEQFLGPACMSLAEVYGLNHGSGRCFTVCGAGNPEQEPVLTRQLYEFEGVDHVEARPVGFGAW